MEHMRSDFNRETAYSSDWYALATNPNIQFNDFALPAGAAGTYNWTWLLNNHDING